MTHRAGADLDGLDDWTGPPLGRHQGRPDPTDPHDPRWDWPTIPPGILVFREDLCGAVPTGASYSSRRISRPMGLQTTDAALAAHLRLVLELAAEIGERSGEKIRRFAELGVS